jgi:hypothetical protein
MAKIIKALKKLTTLRSKPAQAAKKAAPSKKKTQPLATKKGAKAPKKTAAPAKGKLSPKEIAKAKAAAAKLAAAEKKAKEKEKLQKAKEAAALKEKLAKEKAAAKAAKEAAAQALREQKAQEKAAAKAAKEAAAEEARAAKRRAKEEAEQPVPEEEIVLLDAEGRRYCRVKDCDQAAMVEGYCRYHYLLFWKNIQIRKKILTEGKLERYIEELTARYPDKYLDMLKKDLRSEKEFMAAIAELEIDEAAVDGEFEDEAQNYLDEVRGMGSEPAAERDEDF